MVCHKKDHGHWVSMKEIDTEIGLNLCAKLVNPVAIPHFETAWGTHHFAAYSAFLSHLQYY